MRIMANVLAAVLITVVSVGAQQKPDFSGNWVIAQSPTGLLGEKFTAVQDAKALSLTITVGALGRDVKVVYALDGSESRNLNPVGGGQPDEPIFSRTSWDGDKLVVLTRGTNLVNGKPVESKRVIWIDKEGLLTIERSAEGAPTVRSVYQRSK